MGVFEVRGVEVTRRRVVRANPWSLWLTTVVGSFVAMESRALVKGDIPTLSECLARWCGVHPRRRHGSVAPLAFVAAAGWLAVHIATWGSGAPGDASRWVPVAERWSSHPRIDACRDKSGH